MNASLQLSTPGPRRPEQGVALIEVLVSVLVLLFGLLGAAGLLVRAQQAEFESYQRKQAVMVLDEMVSRLQANREVASCYAITTNAGSGSPFLGHANAATYTCTAGSLAQQTTANADLLALQSALLGAGESIGGANVGALLNGRGCITAAGNVYTLSVAWQGTVETGPPPAASTCGLNLYGSESLRRVISVSVVVPTLT